MRGKFKGQVTIIALFLVFIGLVVFAALSDPMGEIIAGAEGNIDPTAYLLIRLIPFMMAATLLGSLLIYSRSG